MTITHDRRLTVALTGALALLVLLGVLSFTTSRRLDEAARRIAQTQRVILQLQRFRSGIEATETGMRGYLLTGDRSYLASFQAGRVRAPAATARPARRPRVRHPRAGRRHGTRRNPHRR